MKLTLRNLLLVGLIAIPVVPIALSGCTTTSEGEHGFKRLEDMSEADYQRLKLYSTLGVKITANRLVQEGVVSAEELQTVATALAAIKTTPITGGAELFISDLLAKSGLTTVESQSLLELVVFELQARGVLSYLNDTGTIALTPRTENFIDALIDAVKTATVVTPEELHAAKAVGVTE
jgi:hypothetical protein